MANERKSEMTREEILHLIICFLIIVIILLTYFYVISTNKNDFKSRMSIQTLVKKKIALTTAVGKNGDNFIINSLTGLTQNSCGKPNIESNQDNSDNSKCETRIIVPIELKKLIEDTSKPFQGSIFTKDGEEITTSFSVIVSTSYKGSYCSTIFVAGEQYENCITQKEECEYVRENELPLSEGNTLDMFLEELPICQKHITS